MRDPHLRPMAICSAFCGRSVHFLCSPHSHPPPVHHPGNDPPHTAAASGRPLRRLPPASIACLCCNGRFLRSPREHAVRQMMQAADRDERACTPRRKHSMSHPSAAPPLAEAVVPSRSFPLLRPLSSLPHVFPVPQRAAPPVDALVKCLFVVYDADGTPAGEFIYMTKKFLGLGHCAACDITHGPREEKPEFTRLKKGREWGVPLVNIHRDEMDDSLAAAVGMQLPCVAARTETRDVMLLGQDALATCEGDVGRFQELVDLALSVHRLVAPGVEKTVGEEGMDVSVTRQMQNGSYVPFAVQTQTVQLSAGMQVEEQGQVPMQVEVTVPGARQVVQMKSQMFVKQKQMAEKWEWRPFETRGIRVDDDAVVPGSRS